MYKGLIKKKNEIRFKTKSYPLDEKLYCDVTIYSSHCKGMSI